MATPSRRLVMVLVPVAVALEVISLVGTLWGYAVIREHSANEDRTRCERLIAGAETTLALRLATYEQALWGAAGLFNASAEVTPGEWDAYIGSIRPGEHLPGVLGLGWIEAVPTAGLEAYVQRQRRELPDFQVKALAGMPSVPDEYRYVISYVVPSDPNATVIGLDLSGDPDRREVLDGAWTSRRARISRIIDLVQDQDASAGMVLAVPVDARADRNRLWVYAPLLGWQVFAGILPDDGGEITAVIREDDPGGRTIATLGGGAEPDDALHLERHLHFAGRTWVGSWRTTAGFRSADRGESALLLGLGLGLSATLLVVLHQLFRSLRRSDRLVDQAVHGRDVVEARLLGTLRAAGVALFTVSPGGRPSALVGAVPSGLGENWFAGVAEVEASEILRTALALGGEGPPGHQVLRLRLGPAQRWYRCHLGRLGGSGEIIGVLVDISDLIRVQEDLLTSRHQAQADLARSVDLARARGRRLAAAGRSLGQHLAALRACISGLDRLGLDPQQRHLLQTIGGAGLALAREVDEIREVTAIEARSLGIASIPFRPQRLAADLDRRLGPRIRGRGLTLQIAIGDLPPILRGDPRRILRLIDDLVADVLAHEGGGTIRIAVNGDSAITGPLLLIEVQDQRTAGGGSDTLGQVLAREVCTLLGGHLAVHAGAGGTTVTVRLPLATAAAGDADLLADLEGAEVLVLPDGSQDRPLIQVLGLAGTTITVASYRPEDGPPATAQVLIAEDPPGAAALAWPRGRVLFARHARPGDARTVVIGDDQDLAAQVAALRRLLATQASVPPRSDGLRALLADDHPVNRRLASLILGRHGATVTLAEDGAEAIRRHRVEAVDLLLMDCQMPVCDGLEATRRIRAAERARGASRTVIIGISTAVGDADRRRASEAGMDGLLPRPLSEDDLARLIADLPRLRAGPGSPPLIGPSFARLRDSLDAETLADLVRTTRTALAERRDRVADAAARGDRAAIAQEAHSTKGAATGMGLEDLRQRSADLECLIRADDDGATIDAALRAWLASLAATLEALPGA